MAKNKNSKYDFSDDLDVDYLFQMKDKDRRDQRRNNGNRDKERISKKDRFFDSDW